MWQIPLLAIGGYCALVVYELGHLLAARAFGINAVVVTIGLGPTIGRLSDGSGTILAFRVLPVRSTCGFYDGPESLKPTKPNTRPSIGGLSIPRRAAILIAGPFSNVAFACALLLVTHAWDPDFAAPNLGKTGSEIASALFVVAFKWPVRPAGGC
ncbi:M50 family metallopeptidase [Bradyrhizobium barranii]|uniref:M50 family metallopeptidase n=1 Tax=Bradyrhizobium barranii TaxID=2992140 RepID=A0ABY3QWW4_9BRAD|nr:MULTISPECIES: site-2 protease family protein [Bradyrhizobium]UFW90113.1 M50 family metallopeptidase [Bradyrhizobium japonicum]